MSLTSRQKEILAIAERLTSDRANLLGDGYIISEPFGKNRHMPLNKVMRNSPVIEDAYGLGAPHYDDNPTQGGIGTRYQLVRLHSYLSSGLSGPQTVQTFLTIEATPPSSNGIADINDARIIPLINPEFSVGKANAAEPDVFKRGFSLALYPAKSTAGVGTPLAADTTKGPISPLADPSAGPPSVLEPGAGNGGFWTVDYEAGIVRFSAPPLNGPQGVMNPNNVYGDINGNETLDAYGAITMFATFYQYTGAFGFSDNPQFITVGDGYISEGIYTGNDQNTLQMAVNALDAVGGGTVFIKEGTYSFNGTVTVPGNISIVGLNGANILQFGNATIFRISGGEVELKNLTLISNSTTSAYLVQIYPIATSQKIENVKITDIDFSKQSLAGAIGFRTDFNNTAFNNIFIDKCRFSHSGIFGVPHISVETGTFKGNFSNIRITDGYFKATIPPSIEIFASRVQSLNNLHLHNNFFEGELRLFWDSVTATTPVISKSFITNNYCAQNILVGSMADSVVSDNNVIGFINIAEKTNTYLSNNRSTGLSEGIRTRAGGQLWIAADEIGQVMATYNPTGLWGDLSVSTIPSSIGTTVYDIVYNKKDLFVLVGYDGANGIIYTSVDGFVWRKTTKHPFAGSVIQSVAYDGKSLWVAGGTAPTRLAVSYDGINWTPLGSRLSNIGFVSNILDIAHNGKDLWVIVSDIGQLATSPDGINWTLRESGFEGGATQINCIAHDEKDLWLIGTASDQIASSRDGATWTISSGTVFGGSGSINSIAHNGRGLWVIVGGDGLGSATIATSLTGTSEWALRHSVVSAFTFKEVAYNGFDRWVALGGDAAFVTSHNGISWSLPAGSLFSGAINALVSVSNSNAGIIAHGSNYNGTGIQAFGHGNLGIGVEGWGGDGYSIGIKAVGGSAGGSGIIALGGRGGGTGIEAFGDGYDHSSSSGFGIVSSGKVGGKFIGSGTTYVAIGTGGILITSSNGTDWVPRESGFGAGNSIFSIQHNGRDLWVIGGTSSKLATSSDGIKWIERDSGFESITDVVFGIEYGQNKWIAVGTAGKMSVSNDGINWHRINNTFSTLDTIYGITYNGKDLWIAVGSNGKLATSPDGITWIQRNNGFGTDTIYTVGYNSRDLWVAAGTSGKLATSPDGINWEQRTSSFGSDYIVNVSHNGKDIWVAAGDQGKIATSNNGINWTQRTSSFGTNTISGVVYNGHDLWVATGIFGTLATSPDGITWTQRTSGVSTAQNIQIAAALSNSNAGIIAHGSEYNGTGIQAFGHGNLGIGVEAFGGDGYGAGIVSRGGLGGGTGVIGVGGTNGGIGIEAIGDGYGAGIRSTGGGTSGTGIVGIGGFNGGIGIEAAGDGYGHWGLDRGTGIKSVGKVGGKFIGSGTMYVAVGNSGKIATSQDGLVWTQRKSNGFTETINDVEYDGKGTWVLGTSGTATIAYSFDGIVWTRTSGHGFLGSESISSITHNGKDLWMAVGSNGKISTSPDGIFWTRRNSNIFGFINQAAYNGKDLWVAVSSNGEITTSPDGIHWTARSNTFGGSTIGAVIHNRKGLWVAAGDAGKLATSQDGIIWTQRTSSFSSDFIWHIAHDGRGLLVAGGNSGKIATSINGINWIQRTSSFGSDFIFDIVHNGKDLWIAVGGSGKIATSPDAITWTQISGGGFDSSSIAAIAAIYNSNAGIIAHGSNYNGTGIQAFGHGNLGIGVEAFGGDGYGAGIVSRGGLGGGTGIISYGGTDGGIAIEAISDGYGYWGDDSGVGVKSSGRVGGKFIGSGALYLAAADNGLMTMSSDGIDWTLLPDISGMAGVIDIAHNGKDLWVAVGTGNTKISTSSDGIYWTPQDAGPFGAFNINAIAYDGKGLWVGVSDSGTLCTSPDGAVWTSRNVLNIFPPFDVGNINTVAHDGKDLWALGTSNGFIATSYDGIHWTARTDDLGVQIFDMAYNYRDLWVAVGTSGALFTSPDGMIWTTRDSSFGASFISAVAHNGKDLWVAVGQSSKIATSINGINWTQRTSNIPGGVSVNDVIHNGKDLWIAVADTSRIATSTDGITWVLRVDAGHDVFGLKSINTIAALYGANAGIRAYGSEYSGTGVQAFGRGNLGIGVQGFGGDGYGIGVKGVGGLGGGIGLVGIGGAATDGYEGMSTGIDSGLGLYAQGIGLSPGIESVGGLLGGVGGSFAGRGVMYVVVGGSGKMNVSYNGIDWVPVKSSFDATSILDIAFGDGTWIAVGGSGKLATSPDGINWTQRTNNFGSVNIASIAYNGKGQWIATSGTQIATSTDNGITWVQRTHGFVDAGSTISTVYHNGRDLWVAVGDNAHMETSPDGINWTWVLTSLGETIAEHLVSLTFSGNLWVSGSLFNGSLVTSPDGYIWTRRPNPFSGADTIRGIAHNGKDLWVAVGSTSSTAAVMTSPNAINWTEHFNITSGTLFDVIHNGKDLWITTGVSGKIYTSPDGVTWTIRSNSFIADSIFAIAVADTFNAGVMGHGSDYNGAGIIGIGGGNAGYGIIGYGGDGYGVGVRGLGGSTGGVGVEGLGGTIDGYGGIFVGGAAAGSGILSIGAGQGSGIIGIGGSAGYGVVAQGDYNKSLIKSALRIVPQGDDPVHADAGAVYVNDVTGLMSLHDGYEWGSIPSTVFAGIDTDDMISNSTALATFTTTHIIKANSVRQGSIIRARAAARVEAAPGGGNLTFSIYYGTTEITATNTQALTNQRVVMEFEIILMSEPGSSATWGVSATWHFGTRLSDAAAGVDAYMFTKSTIVDQVISLKALMTANNSLELDFFSVEKVN